MTFDPAACCNAGIIRLTWQLYMTTQVQTICMACSLACKVAQDVAFRQVICLSPDATIQSLSFSQGDVMHTLICGSMAYDTIMVFQDQFKKHILPEKIHILNVAFLVPEMRREFGGCAGNIAYNLKLLGGNPLIMATVGDDFSTYAVRLEKLGLTQAHIRHVSGSYTGQAFITTDLDDNQITAFHPGAMSFSEQNHVGDAKSVNLGIVSPDGREGM